MKRPDYALLALLLAFATFIWMRDMRWLDSAGDTLPILAALPVAIWLGAPWKAVAGPWSMARRPALLAAALFPFGMLLDSTLLLTASWTGLAWSWVSRRFQDGNPPVRRKLLALAFVSFPWIATELASLAWWFRLSGAAGAEQVLGWAGFSVVRQGTFMLVDNFAVSVEPACSGMNGLQALLVAGTTLAYLQLRHTTLFWWNLALLPVAAWTANLIRIVIGSAAGASMTPESAARWVEPLHLFAGWIALVVMFGLCWVLFSAQEKPVLSRVSRAGVRGPALPWLETVLVAYAMWSCRGLLDTWLTAPYDRLGWLAFALWLMPLVVWARGAEINTRVDRLRVKTPWRAGVGVALLVVGDATDLNFVRHAGLACVLAGFAPAGGAAILGWWASAVAWLPALGWIGSRLNVPPDAFATVRVAVAIAAVIVARYLGHSPRRSATPARTLSLGGSRASPAISARQG